MSQYDMSRSWVRHCHTHKKVVSRSWVRHCHTQREPDKSHGFSRMSHVILCLLNESCHTHRWYDVTHSSEDMTHSSEDMAHSWEDMWYLESVWRVSFVSATLSHSQKSHVLSRMSNVMSRRWDMTHSWVVSRTSHVWSRMSHVMRQPTQHTATHCNTLHQHRPKEMRMRHPPESWFGIACVADVAIRNATICCCCHLQRNYVLLIANIICYQQPIVHLLRANALQHLQCIICCWDMYGNTSAMHYLLLIANALQMCCRTYLHTSDITSCIKRRMWIWVRDTHGICMPKGWLRLVESIKL